MEWTRTDAVRRWIVAIGLVAGPVLLALSNVFVVEGDADSIRAGFDAMVAAPEKLLIQSLLEGVGFTLVLATYAGAPQALRMRGGALGTAGAALCALGILGFGISSARGITLGVLAAMPDHDAAFAAARAVAFDGVSGTIEMVLTIVAQLGICLVVAGLIRAHIVRIWPLLLVVAGIIVNVLFGMVLTTFVADLLLLAASGWVAVRLLRVPGRVWLGEGQAEPRPAASSHPHDDGIRTDAIRNAGAESAEA